MVYRDWSEGGSVMLASELQKVLALSFNQFVEDLDGDHEMVLGLLHLGQVVILRLEHMGYSDPFLISFAGVTDSGESLVIIQHVGMISMSLMKVKRKNPNTARRPIGFHSTLAITANSEP